MDIDITGLINSVGKFGDTATMGTNYFNIYSFRMRQIFKVRKLLGVVEGTETRESLGAEEWERKNNEAMLLIVFSIADSQILKIQQYETAKDVWDSLVRTHSFGNGFKRMGTFL